MFDLFYKRNTLNEATIEDSHLPFLRETYQREMDKITYYYHNRMSKVNNNHLLVRLITTASPGYTLPFEDYVREIEANSKYYARNFGIVTDGNVGETKRDVMFGSGSEEVFLFTTDAYNIFEIESTWKTVNAVRVIYHSLTDIDFLRPDETIDFYAPTVFIYGIDVKTLLLQYRYWALEQLSMENGTDPAVFVYQYVMTNMMKDIMDISMYNRAIAILKGESLDTYIEKRHPFSIVNYISRIDDVIKKHVDYIAKSSRDFSTVLEMLPTLFSKNGQELIFNTNLNITTRQSRWAKLLTMLFFIRDILNISNGQTIRRNKNRITDLRMDLRLYERDRSATSPMTDYLTIEYETCLLDIKEKLGA